MEKKEIFSNGFDLEAYSNEQLLDIDNLKEREQAKALYESFFKPFYQYMEQRYVDFEKQMEQKYYGKENDFCIVTGICERSRLSLYEEYMFPMLLKDTKETSFCMEKIQEDIQRKEKSYCYTVFVQMDERQIKKLLMGKRTFRGVVYTADGEFPAEFVIIRNQEYREQINILKDIFLKNQIPWKPLFAPYLNRFFDVYVVSMDYPVGEIVQRVIIDFEEFTPFIKYQYVPIWNIEDKKRQSSTYPACQKDSVNYIHTIFASQLNEKSDYLVCNKADDYWGIGRIEGDLQICSKQSEPIVWKLLELHADDRKSMEKEYPFYCNKSVGSAGVKGICTKAEIKRFINGFELEEYMELTNIRYEEDAKLVLEFQNKIPDYYLRYDILDYIVSRVKWELKEYECMGVFR